MMKRLVVTLVFCLFAGSLIGQKVKYKDLYPLLSVKKYEDGEPFLREFLKDEKNIDHPNANFQMALILHDKALKDDVLREEQKFNHHVDSAILYYKRADTYIDEKEVRKNDVFYEAYQRRDIRTGKFGINQGDIQFDIEEKIKALQIRKEKVSALVRYFYASKIAYDSARLQFGWFRQQFPTEKQLILRLTDEDIQRLDQIESNYQTAVKNFDNYENTLSTLDRIGYSQELNRKEIKNYENDGMAETDMFASIVEFWDYDEWSKAVKDSYKNEIYPVFEQLISYDHQLGVLNDLIFMDSVSVIDKIPPMASIKGLLALKKYDADPMPISLFEVKMASLYYDSYTIEHMDYKDSADVVYRLDVLTNQYNLLKDQDSLVNQLLAIDLEEEGLNYAPYVKEAYGSQEQLRRFVKEKLDGVIAQRKLKEIELEGVKEAFNWLVTERDSIPLFMSVEDIDTDYRPVLIDTLLTTGIYYQSDSLTKGYMAKITRSRRPDLFLEFEVDTTAINATNYSSLKAKTIVLSKGEEVIYFVMLYVPLPEQENYSATLVKANDSGLIWIHNLTLATTPGQLGYNIQTDEIIINYAVNGAGSTELIGEKLVLSKDGQVRN